VLKLIKLFDEQATLKEGNFAGLGVSTKWSIVQLAFKERKIPQEEKDRLFKIMSTEDPSDESKNME
jgi:hypothetical protein